MYTHESRKAVRGTIEDLLFSHDPEARRMAAANLGESPIRVADKRDALEALNTALGDPCTSVQEAVLQSLVRMSVK